jgi:type I restriction enzyme M protein
MPFAYRDPKEHGTMNSIYTPAYVAKWLFVLTKHLKPATVFDPACGEGALLKPWCRNSMAIGMDIDAKIEEPKNWTLLRADFLHSFPNQEPDLVICNPPWCKGPGNKSHPFLFFRRIVELYGPDMPIILLCPMGFRLNQRVRSSRRGWFLDANRPEITSVISCPIDMYPDTQFHSEILLFNIPRVKPHYWLPAEKEYY